jgi:hypothetical protein
VGIAFLGCRTTGSIDKRDGEICYPYQHLSHARIRMCSREKLRCDCGN